MTVSVSQLSVWLCVLCLILLQMSVVEAVRTEKVCTSKDIRNKVEEFYVLENCTVIEGSLHILLIDYAKAPDFQHLSFPDLVEITEYLLLYRVYGLKSLSQIFPNLSVIRGQSLFFNYALVAFEMPAMEELGLPSLSRVVRGAIRIEKNAHLCYIDTIDWTQITTVKHEDNFIIENKDIDECANVCPRRENGQPLCPTMKVDLGNGEKRDQQLCWTSQHCQKICPQACGDRSCYIERSQRDKGAEKCCHNECLGGCTGPKDTDCTACAHIFYEGRCIRRCPPGTYEFQQRRCITEMECRQKVVHGSKHWKVFREENKCLKDCPSGYIESREDKFLCEKCNGPCPRVCNALMVDSVSAAQQIKGCTVLSGVLEIQIRGGKHVGKELEESLGDIEEVRDYIIITKAHAITNFRFLKNLRLIRGESLHEDRHALVVIDNQNLRDIWDFNTHPQLEIKRGQVYFHYNRKLCLHIIDRLTMLSGINSTDDKDVSRETNGDLIPCQTEELRLEIVSHHPTHAIIRWTNFILNDNRELLGWVINLREAPFRNVTMYDSRDACGTDEWTQEDVSVDTDRNAVYVAHILYQLKPFTQYAVYVQTFTVAQAQKGAMSPIVYFTTNPDVPWPAQDIEVSAVNHGELHVTWKPPWKPNGNVTHYFVYWYPQILDRKKLDQRNYCEDKLRLLNKKKETVIDSGQEENATAISGECCACPKSKEQQIQEEEERQMQIKFEDYLHDTVYVKRPFLDENETIRAAEQGDLIGPIPNTGRSGPGPGHDNARRKRRYAMNTQNISDHFPSSFNYTNFMNMTKSIANINTTEFDKEKDDPESYEMAIVYGKTEVILPNLKHFQEYNIEVIACHDYVEDQKIKRCSNRAITTYRTMASETADTLDPRNITSANGTYPGQVFLSWSDPISPNGLIVTYEIELILTDTPNFKPVTLCITHKKFWEEGGFHLEQRNSGNWSFRIRATSLAGNGSWTPTMYFYVPDLTNPDDGFNVAMIAGVSAFAALLVILVVAISIWLVAKKRFNPTIPDGILYASVNPEYWSAADVYVPDEWEVSRDKIELIRELGQGSFGMVYEGTAMDIVSGEHISKVAIKTVNENASVRDRIEFLNEASVMKVFDCNHVVKLRGVVSKGQPTLVIMELMSQGDLKSYLRSHRPDENDRPPPTLKEILQTAGEVADGMAYLAAKKFVHRDLAARNCMVSEFNVVKIGDFGMTREIYETDYYRKGGKGLLPVRWMAPESLQDGLFTSQSDVWSYGVVLWEMATLAAQPYQGLANEQVLHFVIDRGIMEKPEGCPDKLYEVMQLCWKHSPRERPTFCEIIDLLVPYLNPSFENVSYYFSAERKNAVAAAEAAAAEAEMERSMGEEDADDSRTPLTSPYRTHKDHERSDDACLHMDPEEDSNEKLPDSLSRRSTLSYDSFSSAPNDSGGGGDNRQPPASTPNKRQPHVITTGNKQPSHRWEPPEPQRPNPVGALSADRHASRNNIANCPIEMNSNCHSPPTSGTGSNEGSKESSKSSDSSHSGGINGIVNGQVHRYITPSQC